MYNRFVTKSIIESFIDNVLRDKVEPVEGSILYCDLVFGLAEHSGVYIGNNQIVHLDGSGKIEVVSPKQFLGRLNGFNNAITIYVSCKGVNAIGSKDIAQRAKSMINSKRKYNLLNDNCHQFTVGCMTNDFENNENFLYLLKNRVNVTLESDNWRAWDLNASMYISSSFVKSIETIEPTSLISQTSNDDIIEVDSKEQLDIQIVKMAAILLHYVLDKKCVLPIDILEFETMLLNEFQIDDTSILEDLFNLKKNISDNQISELIEAIYPIFDKESEEKVFSFIDKIVIDNNHGNYNKYRDIRLHYRNCKYKVQEC